MLEIRVPEPMPDVEIVGSEVEVFATSLSYCDKNFNEDWITFDFLEIDVNLPTSISITDGEVVIKPLSSVSIRLHWNANIERIEIYLSKAF